MIQQGMRQMGVFTKSRSGADKKGNGSSRQTIYVWLASDEAIFLINGEVRESKYSFGVPIVPLYGKFKSTKEKKVYSADELKGYTVVLNLPKNTNVDELKEKKVYSADELKGYTVVLNLPKNTNVDELKGKKVVVLGYSDDEVFVGVYEDEREGAES